ncbi:hypothetical protein SS50377_24578 [Spironucleus salmonicida]|uniref:Uncharacterized protein n=1 Tax=Spironucleus salmonicida TaxID=348837 RepID=V6LUT0_9EUKA|nr:hypothetical protein SS50377_24578 [Spironucleus salmonicida]|eukprot:EST44564.1 Hypothetical protein SS50377_15566 [Spironucleus salmonicida]
MKFIEDLTEFLLLPIFIFTYIVTSLLLLYIQIRKCFIKIVKIKVRDPIIKLQISKLFRQTQYFHKEEQEDATLKFNLIQSNKYNVAVIDKAYQKTILLIPPFLETHQNTTIESAAVFFLQQKYNVHVLIAPGILSPATEINHEFIYTQNLEFYLTDYPNSNIIAYEFGCRKPLELLQKGLQIHGKIVLINCNFDWFQVIHTVINKHWNEKAGKTLKDYYYRNKDLLNAQAGSKELIDKFIRKQTFSSFDNAFFVENYGFYSQEDMYQTMFHIPENLQKEFIVINAKTSLTTNSYFHNLTTSSKFNYIVLSNGDNVSVNGYGDDLFLEIAKIWITQ